MKSIHERDDRQLASPFASGAGHSLTQVLEEVLHTGLIHGEVAALGGVAFAGLQMNMRSWLDFSINVRYGIVLRNGS
ncbi:MAG: hypothetical protein Ct9H300mP19_13450 [Dehalococcoidia bacterium]|nr:MAG: hypothetical protein Ct9H300mP19_13450 [Dehalococcoidia bacterium]